jgi:Fe-S-cluster containining protein
MKAKSKKNKKLRGLHFPEDEKKFTWLPMLLHAFQVMDQGVNLAIRQEEARGKKLACCQGCSVCCRMESDIPIYPLEMVGMAWYAGEKIPAALRIQLAENLKNHIQGKPCPFLIDHACSVYTMRPMACRQYNVFQKACAEGEDAFYSRKEDVLIPIREYADKAFFLILPFYGVTDPTERKNLIQRGGQHTLAKVLQQMDWKNLGDKLRNTE